MVISCAWHVDALQSRQPGLRCFQECRGDYREGVKTEYYSIEGVISALSKVYDDVARRGIQKRAVVNLSIDFPIDTATYDITNDPSERDLFDALKELLDAGRCYGFFRKWEHDRQNNLGYSHDLE